MPIYEFRCNNCRRKSSHFKRTVASPLSPMCPACGSNDLARCISVFAYHKSEQTILEERGGPSMSPHDPDYFKDPRMIGRETENRLKEMGIDMRGEEHRDTFKGVTDMIDAARDGQLPPALKDL